MVKTDLWSEMRRSESVSEGKTEKAKCRGCGMTLNGKPYYTGGNAYNPIDGERCKVNYYGGFVCSSACDYNSSLRLEQSMPGHGLHQTSIGQLAREHYEKNWYVKGGWMTKKCIHCGQFDAGVIHPCSSTSGHVFQ